jgi:hypothetical protein
MALVLDGSECPFCGQPMWHSRGDRITAFPPFVGNPLDPLEVFSDGAFHEECVRRHPLGKEALARIDYGQKNQGRLRRCAGCGQDFTVHTFEAACIFYHLTSDPSQPAFQFNYHAVHPECLAGWDRLDEAIGAIEALWNSGAWGGDYLPNLLATLEAARREDPGASD